MVKMRKKIIAFLIILLKKINDNELIQNGNALSFKLILATFPFLIFLMSTLSFLKVDYSYLINLIFDAVPPKAEFIIAVFLNEVIYNKSLGILSSSLLLALYSSSSGFHSAIKALNGAFEISDKRNWFVQRFVSIIGVVIFTFLIALSLIVLIFSDTINAAMKQSAFLSAFAEFLAPFYVKLIVLIFLFILISIVYIIAVNRQLGFKDVMPGSIFTLILWIVISRLFNIYINNFSKLSTIYGSIGGIFILFYWINFISTAFLIGGQINAVLLNRKL